MLAAERGHGRNTLAAYGRDLARLEEFLAARGSDVDTCGPENLRRFMAGLARAGMSARTSARFLSTLRQFFSFLQADGFRADNPAQHLDSPRLGRPLPKILSEDEVAALIAAAFTKTGDEGLRLRALIELLYASGLRVSELVSLPLGAVDLARLVVRVKGKGGKERLVPLGEPAAMALRAYLERRARFVPGTGKASKDAPPPPSRFLFPSRSRAGHLTRQRFDRLLRELAAEAGLAPGRVSAHVLRHAFATHLLDLGADLRSVQKLLGHADIATTQIYTHVVSDRLKAAVSDHHPLSKSENRRNRG